MIKKKAKEKLMRVNHNYHWQEENREIYNYNIFAEMKMIDESKKSK